MSSDLLAEFDSFYSPQQPQQANKNPADGTSQLKPSAFGDLSFFDAPIRSNATVHKATPQWPTSIPDHKEDLWNFQAPAKGSNPSAYLQHQSRDIGNKQEPNLGAAQPQSQTNDSQDWAFGDQVKPRLQRASTMELFSSNMVGLTDPTSLVASTTPSLLQSHAHRTAPRIEVLKKPLSDPNVLFDADDFNNDDENEDEDDFGDFETVESSLSQPSALQQQSHIASLVSPSSNGLSHMKMSSKFNNSTYSPYPQAPKSPSFQERNPFAELALSTAAPSSRNSPNGLLDIVSPVTAWPVYESKESAATPHKTSILEQKADEEDWGDFEVDVQLSRTEDLKEPVADNWDWNAVDSPSTSSGRTTALKSTPQPAPHSALQSAPPTNIPPPSVLLSIFPQLLDLPNSSLFKSLNTKPFALKNRIISDPTTIDFLRAYIALTTVGARIIAGRKLRWKRDTLLSQAMKIGPAAAGGKGGMKLAGIDKAEATREDREAGDVVRIWKEQVGRLRSAVATANSSLKDQSIHLVLPDIAEIMPIKIASGAEGGLSGPKCCILCGLKREERISKVDVKVEDSFGEWWVDHWGHRTCQNFWAEHQHTLKQR